MANKDAPATICSAGDHDWEYLTPEPEVGVDVPAESMLVPTHRCRTCQVTGMMEVLNDGRPAEE